MALGLLQVGAGAWGESWIRVVQQHPDWELAGLIDIDESVLQRAASTAAVSPDRCFGGLDEALGAGVRADAVLIAVPPAVHAPVALEALGHGLHCLIEKPLADTLPAAWSIVKAAEAGGLEVMVSQNYRFKRAPRTVRRLIAEGVIGPVEQVRVDFRKNPPFSGFRLEMDEPLIHDMAVHHLDQLRGILGLEPDVIRARSWNPSWSAFAGNAACLIELEHGDGGRVVYTGSWCALSRHTSWDGDWEIEGPRGSIRWSENRVEVRFESLFDTVFLPGALERDGVMEVELDVLEAEERNGSLAEFAQALREGRPPETNARDNVRSLSLVLGAVESAASGNAVDLGVLAAEPESS
jgi:predicted dehydrogenase